MTLSKKLFISYSHRDEAFAKKFATALHQQGQPVWLAEWEIGPGDSLVDKIFEEGLRDAGAVAVLLSKESVKSKWVREELSVAMIKRIENLTRLIPILIEDVELPTALRALHWVDMRSNFDEGVRAIVNVLSGVSEKPPVGAPPGHLKRLSEPVSGLSRLASTVGRYLLE